MRGKQYELTLTPTLSRVQERELNDVSVAHNKKGGLC